MVRAVIKDRRGDIVRGPLHFLDDVDLAQFQTNNKGPNERAGWKVERIEDSVLTADQLGTYELLRKIAAQANGVVRSFVFDADMHRRWQNRQPTADDVKKLADSMRFAADQLVVLATKEFHVGS